MSDPSVARVRHLKATEGTYPKTDGGINLSMNQSGIGCAVSITLTRVGSSPVVIKRLAFYFRGRVQQEAFSSHFGCGTEK